MNPSKMMLGIWSTLVAEAIAGLTHTRSPPDRVGKVGLQEGRLLDIAHGYSPRGSERP